MYENSHSPNASKECNGKHEIDAHSDIASAMTRNMKSVENIAKVTNSDVTIDV
jgi:hypothetical protein